MEKFVKAEKTKTGLFGLWEKGGTISEFNASSVVIARRDGSMPKAIFAQREVNGKHALIVLQKGFLVIEVSLDATVWDIDIFRVDEISADGEVKLVRKNYRQYDEWEGFLDPKFKPAIKAALAKAKTWFCQDIFYANLVSKKGV